MDVAVFGLGYVGSVTAACLALAGHRVVGVEVDPYKIRCFQEGRSPVLEPGLSTCIRQAKQLGTLHVTEEPAVAVEQSEIALLCVGTPSGSNGQLDLTFLQRVCEQIGEALALRSQPYTVAVRSTVPPGTCEQVLIPLIEQTSAKRHGEDFDLCVNPEFLREGSAVEDFMHPPLVVIGAQRDVAAQRVARLYEHLGQKCHFTDLRTAEMVKYASNAFHALKITFANEIGAWCKAYEVDSHQVMQILVEDTKLNLSPAYLKPGFAFGGSCLPKDLRSLVEEARLRQVHLPLLEAILFSNQYQIERVAQLILQLGKQPIGVVGLAFKATTDDLRESPAIALCKRLLHSGCALRLYDPKVDLSTIYGSNREFLFRELPSVEQLLCRDLKALVEECAVIVVTTDEIYLQPYLSVIQPRQILVDLCRALSPEAIRGQYIGLYW